MSQKITLVGAGLVGSLLAIFLARRGYNVDVLERRPDMRKEKIAAGRSINLAISTRGINALKILDIESDIMQHAIPMRGRMIHPVQGDLAFQAYGKDDSEYINSMSRGTLNQLLMNHAEETGLVKFHFNQRVTGINIKGKTLQVVDEASGKTREEGYDIAIGTDGTASAIRDGMVKQEGYKCTDSALSYGYKELTLPAGPGGSFLIERNALHIWPRGTYMLIALPNMEASFTCTLFLPFEGEVSFAKLKTEADVMKFFNEQFPDIVPLLPDLTETFFANPTGHMHTIKTEKWNVGGTVLLMGDAAHGIVPFFGQGMNCGFEDCTVLDKCLEEFSPKNENDWSKMFDHFVKLRRENTDSIADMAVENFVEMRDKVGDPKFLMAKGVEKLLQNKFPGRYISRYSLVTFSNVPYVVAYEAGTITDEILGELCSSIKSPEEVDLVKAEKLIDQKLAPLLARHARELSLTGTR
jgi:kynurenine 3-monooxygenase